MKWRPHQPYNDLPQLPPATERLETRAVLKACIPARAALAELRQVGELLPDQGLLIHLLPVLEARDSSEIENVLTTTDELFRHAQQERGADAATREALRYRNALNQLLLAVTRDEAWEDCILYMLRGVEQVSRWTCLKIAAIRSLMSETLHHVRQRLPKIYSHELVQLIFEQPYCRISSLVERDIARRQTASFYLKQLQEIGVLEEQPMGREKVFAHPKLMRLMTQDSNEITPYPP